MNISRVKPKMRLISVPDATVANFLTKLILLKNLCCGLWRAAVCPGAVLCAQKGKELALDIALAGGV